jgi:hypothetical protein
VNELVKSGVLTLDSFTNEHGRSQPAQFAQLIQLAKNLRREIQNRWCREITRKLSFPSACGIWIARIVAIVSFPTKIALVNKRTALAILPAIAAFIRKFHLKADGVQAFVSYNTPQSNRQTINTRVGVWFRYIHILEHFGRA